MRVSKLHSGLGKAQIYREVVESHGDEVGT